MSSRIIPKSIYRIFVLRVSGKGDTKGSANQIEVLRGFEDVPGVSWLLENFRAEIMSASSPKGRRLRERWMRDHGLKILSRKGREDFLGVTFVRESTRFVLYASTAAQLDEESGNAFTRYLIDFIKEPAFTGHADPDFMGRRDRGGFDDADHPTLCNAFDATRFVRSMAFATELFEAAKFARAAFDVRGVRVDPEGGEAQAMMWQFLAFGSQMETEVGKLRRFVGQLNLARAGCFPQREAATPLGFTIDGGKRGPLRVKPSESAAVAALYSLGMQGLGLDDLAKKLSTEYGVCSSDPKTPGVPLHQLLEPGSAARRLYLTRKLKAYRDGELEQHFVGVLPNRLKPGSGHILKRRWLGHNAEGRHDEHGAITYSIPAPKPTVLGPDGKRRQGWLHGLSDEQEHAAWTALIRKRGWDDTGEPQDPSDLQDGLLTAPAARSGGRRRDEPVMALSRLCLFRDQDADEHGPRTKLFSKADSRRYELRREKDAPTADGMRYSETNLIASWPDHELRGHVAELLQAAAHQVLGAGHELGQLATSPGTNTSDQGDDQKRADLLKEAQKQAGLAGGYDLAEAEERCSDDPDEDRIHDLRERGKEARARAKELQQAAAALDARPDTVELDFGQLRDLIAALKGPFATGLVPATLNRSLREILVGGLRFTPGPDSIALVMQATVELPVASGGSIQVVQRREIAHATGRGPSTAGRERIGDLARRYMVQGHPIEEVAAAGRIKDPVHMLRMIREALTSGSRRHDGKLDRAEQQRRMPDPQRRTGGFASPIVEVRSIIWHELTETPGRPATVSPAYDALMRQVYFAPPSDAALPQSEMGVARPWAWDSNVDRRLDQHTILRALPRNAKQMRADHLGEALTGGTRRKPGARLVLDSSIDIARNGHTYPATLRRLPIPDFPEGWVGHTAHLPAAHKLVGLPLCPHADCPETYATAIVLAPEVLHFGTGLLCRRCRRPAANTAAAARTIFPASVIEWADAQPRRMGSWVSCAAPDCLVDIGAGAGKAWRWDDTTGAVWHTDNCRVGAPEHRFARCSYVDCQLDEGGGLGTVDVTGRHQGRRWHSRQCEHAERRRQRALERSTRIGECEWAECTIDEGAGPGRIVGVHHVQKTHDNRECRNGARRQRNR